MHFLQNVAKKSLKIKETIALKSPIMIVIKLWKVPTHLRFQEVWIKILYFTNCLFRSLHFWRWYCTNLVDEMKRGLGIYISQNREISRNFLPRDEKMPHKLQWNACILSIPNSIIKNSNIFYISKSNSK